MCRKLIDSVADDNNIVVTWANYHYLYAWRPRRVCIKFGKNKICATAAFP